MTSTALVSVGLPIRNGGSTVAAVAAAVLAQDHPDVELVISDNASTDDTEEICREIARTDERVVYLRRPADIGLVPNFLGTLAAARGSYFRWIGDSDRIDPSYVSRCLRCFAEDDRRILVSTQLEYELADGSTTSSVYRGTALGSPDPAMRFGEMLRLLTTGYADLDPLYSMLRRESAARLPFRRILRGDEVYAARLALAGPWGHIPEVLGRRGWVHDRLPRIAARLDVPRWHAPLAAEIQCRELLRAVAEAGLTPAQARRARAEVGRLYLRRIVRAAERGGRKLTRYAYHPATTRSNRVPVGADRSR
jgi:glycosyltransferase involved in cell wall biosynthesis